MQAAVLGRIRGSGGAAAAPALRRLEVAYRQPVGAAAHVVVHTHDHERQLIDCIERYDAVVGCVAWLTNRRILEALSRRPAALVVQKEDFLRPDDADSQRRSAHMTQREKRSLRAAYAAVPAIERHVLYRSSESWLCRDYPSHFGADSDGQAVRCAGNANVEKRAASPKMHDKFCVFCDIWDRMVPVPGTEDAYTDDDGLADDPHPTDTTVAKWQGGACEQTYRVRTLVPRAVWTGSFNWSHNAARSLENAVFIESDEIAAKMYDEFLYIYTHSEPLDWTQPWSEPEYKLEN